MFNHGAGKICSWTMSCTLAKYRLKSKIQNVIDVETCSKDLLHVCSVPHFPFTLEKESKFSFLYAYITGLSRIAYDIRNTWKFACL